MAGTTSAATSHRLRRPGTELLPASEPGTAQAFRRRFGSRRLEKTARLSRLPRLPNPHRFPLREFGALSDSKGHSGFALAPVSGTILLIPNNIPALLVDVFVCFCLFFAMFELIRAYIPGPDQGPRAKRLPGSMTSFRS
jgi:hypothetical protein